MTTRIADCDVIMERRRVLLLLAFSPVIVEKENGDEIEKDTLILLEKIS